MRDSAVAVPGFHCARFGVRLWRRAETARGQVHGAVNSSQLGSQPQGDIRSSQSRNCLGFARAILPGIPDERRYDLVEAPGKAIVHQLKDALEADEPSTLRMSPLLRCRRQAVNSPRHIEADMD